MKVSTDPDNTQEIATVDDEKKELLRSVFWDMTLIDWYTETDSWTRTAIVNGEAVEVDESEVTLYIEVSHKSALEMANEYGFDAQQREMLNELLSCSRKNGHKKRRKSGMTVCHSDVFAQAAEAHSLDSKYAGETQPKVECGRTVL